MNVGANGDPPESFDNETIVIAVEPNTDVAARIPPSPRRYVLSAAVSEGWGLAAFNHYADSSSLLEPNRDVPITNTQVLRKGQQGAKVLVPTLPLSAILHMVQNLECYFLKIDTQGMDFKIIQTARHDISRCHYIQAEVYCNGYEGYVGAVNDFDRDWLPFMKSAGFEPVTKCEAGQRVYETNIVWKNTAAANAEPLEAVKEKCTKCTS